MSRTILILSALVILLALGIVMALGQVITASKATATAIALASASASASASAAATAIESATATAIASATATATAVDSATATASPQANCMLYASPSGSGTACSRDSPCDLDTANDSAGPGSTVCLMAGTYQRTSGFYPHSGSASGGYVTFDGGYNGEAILRGPLASDHLVHISKGQYIIVQNLTVDGVDSSDVGVVAQDSHHVIFRHLYVHNAGGAGIESTSSDYVTIDYNLIFHNGYNSSQAWGSGAAVHLPLAIDSAPGFHYYITNNIISGEYDASSYHSEGHGVIIDGGDTQRYSAPVLVANNVIYSNGGRCVLVYNVTGGHWMVNNTCYKNGLDLEGHGCSNGTITRGCQGELFANHSPNNYFVNNIAHSWDIQHPYANSSDICGTVFNHNLWWGNGTNQLPGASVTAMINADPLFVNPPYVSDAIPTVPGTGWFWDALDPRQLGNGLQLQGGSRAINAGIDPATLTTDPAIQAGLQKYVYQDINGLARPQAGAFDLGAYEYSGVVPTAVATQTSTPTPTSSGVIVGHVIWQAIPQPDSRNNGITATLTICPSICAGSTPVTYSVATDAMGFFTVTTGLPDGTYTWAIKGRINLANRGSLTLSGGTANQEMGTMQAGDCNNSNAVEVTDFTIVRATFGKKLGDPGYDSRADFDRTNVVGISDYTLLRGNFGNGGAATTCP